MDEQVALTIFRSGLQTVIFVAMPPLLAALIVGVTIAIFQSITQIQEMTLTFIPKIVSVFVVLMIFFPWMMQIVGQFTVNLLTNIPSYLGY